MRHDTVDVQDTELPGVLTIQPDVFEDHRGEYIETYNESTYSKFCDVKFVQDDISTSRKNVLRGIHGDDETWKLISCLHGKFYLVVVDCDEESQNFGKWLSFVLSDINKLQVLVPPKYGNGHCALTDKIIFHYKQSAYYDRGHQFTYKWNDKNLNIWWPIKEPVLSRRDELLE